MSKVATKAAVKLFHSRQFRHFFGHIRKEINTSGEPASGRLVRKRRNLNHAYCIEALSKGIRNGTFDLLKK
jgi:hypothetical protein